MKVISVNDIHKSYTKDSETIKGVSFEVDEGEIYGLLGPNGAGKSTLMKILIGLWKADSGTVQVPERIGYLPENNPLYEEMYVTEYLQFMASLTASKASGLTGEAGLTTKWSLIIRPLLPLLRHGRRRNSSNR